MANDYRNEQEQKRRNFVELCTGSRPARGEKEELLKKIYNPVTLPENADDSQERLYN